MSRVKILRYFTRPQCRNIVRQITVDAKHPSMLIAIGFGIKMHDLCGRMDTRIRSTSTHHRNFMVSNTHQRLLYFLLNGTYCFLMLPTVIIGAIVRQRHRDAIRHKVCFMSCCASLRCTEFPFAITTANNVRASSILPIVKYERAKSNFAGIASSVFIKSYSGDASTDFSRRRKKRNAIILSANKSTIVTPMLV